MCHDSHWVVRLTINQFITCKHTYHHQSAASPCQVPQPTYMNVSWKTLTMPPLPRLAFNGFPQLAFSPPVLSAAGHPPLQGALCWNWSLGGHWTSPVSKSSCSISPLSNPFLASLASQCHWCHPVTVKTISNHIGLKVNNMTRKSKLCCTLNIKGRTQCERNNAS